MSEAEDQEWLGSVAGAQAPVDELLRREVAALRTAIARRDADLQLTGDEIGRARFLKRLEQEGLLGVKLARRSWAPWLAAAATVTFAVIAFQIMRPSGESVSPATPVETPRGVAGAITLLAADPETMAREVTSDLVARGFRVTRSPRPDRVILEVEVAAGQLDAFRAWAEPRGARVSEPGRYRVIIDRPAPDAAAGPPSP